MNYIPSVLCMIIGFGICLAPNRHSISLLVVQWRNPSLWNHNGRDGVSNHQPHDCLPSRSFRPRSKKMSKLRVTGLCEGNSPVTGEFPAQMASNAENVSIWWRHHGVAKRAIVIRFSNSLWYLPSIMRDTILPEIPPYMVFLGPVVQSGHKLIILILGKFAFTHTQISNQAIILHMLRQLRCRDMCKIVIWLDS